MKSATSRLGLSRSQVHRLYAAWRAFRDAVLVSKKRGVCSNRARLADQGGLHKDGLVCPATGGRPVWGGNGDKTLPRERRARTGELIQVDGCEHYWLNDHQFVLPVFIDDATSRIQLARFVQSENIFGYLAVLWASRGRFMPTATACFTTAPTRRHPMSFVRALRKLGGFYIASAAAPGRGRVERAHRTLQSRLVPQPTNWARRLRQEARLPR